MILNDYEICCNTFILGYNTYNNEYEELELGIATPILLRVLAIQ